MKYYLTFAQFFRILILKNIIVAQNNSFGSKFGTITAIAGSAVGLGNIWKFPYVAGENGGAAFLLIYIGITLLISVPVLLSEFLIGRHGQSNCVKSFIKCHRSRPWATLGVLELLGALLVLSFYCVIAGWSLEYVKDSICGGFANVDEETLNNTFEAFKNSGWGPLGWMMVFLILNCITLGFGVTKGIERCTKFMIPALFIILLVLAIVSLSLPGWSEGVSFLLNPDWSKVTGQTVMKALGQSFFSLSIGMGGMIIYGSYINKKQSLLGVGVIVSLATVLMAILAGLAIFPSVFTYGVDITSGPDLVFKTLPPLFAQLPAGYFVSILFFVLLFFAALTTSLSLIESIVTYLKDSLRLSRTKSICITFVLLAVCSSLCALSQMPDGSLSICGMNLFDLTDNVSSNFVLPLAGLGVVIFAGWILDKSIVYDELTNCGTTMKVYYKPLRFMMRYVCPIVIAYMFIQGLL